MHLRLYLSLALFSIWFVSLLAGFALRGAIHLVLVAALFAFPWKALKAR